MPLFLYILEFVSEFFQIIEINKRVDEKAWNLNLTMGGIQAFHC